MDLEIKKGEFFVLVGPSGSGKTTTLKMINRLVEQSEGSITINGKTLSEYKIDELRWRIGYVLQQIALFPHMSVEENIAVVPELRKWKKERIDVRIDELLMMVGLDPSIYRQKKPQELSGGQQQRVGVVRALAAEPDILLMDEPFSALDPISREKLQDDLLQLQREIKKTIVFVTHDIKEAFKLGDRICVMKEGAIVQVGRPDELLYSPAEPFIKEFIGEMVTLGKHLDGLSLLNNHTDRNHEYIGMKSVRVEDGTAKILSCLQQVDAVRMIKDGEFIGVLKRDNLLEYAVDFLKKERESHDWNC